MEKLIPCLLTVLFTTDGFVDALTPCKGHERLDTLDFAGEDDGSVETDAVEVGLLLDV